jgi:UDP-3-O-acyl-N-acetylglucosamine deacetylase
MAENEEGQGAFIESLKRNNKQIRGDRAEAIGEDAGIRFKRVVEDLEIDIKRKKRERDNMLDMSPDNAMSLMVAKDFDSAKFVERDLELGIEIRDLTIRLEIARARYNELFVGEGA